MREAAYVKLADPKARCERFNRRHKCELSAYTLKLLIDIMQCTRVGIKFYNIRLERCPYWSWREDNVKDLGIAGTFSRGSEEDDALDLGHRQSNKARITAYKRRFPVAKPEGRWNWQDLWWSLTSKIGHTMYILGSSQKEVFISDMKQLCNGFCSDGITAELKRSQSHLITSPDKYQGSADTDDGEKEDSGSWGESLTGTNEPNEATLPGFWLQEYGGCIWREFLSKW